MSSAALGAEVTQEGSQNSKSKKPKGKFGSQLNVGMFILKSAHLCFQIPRSSSSVCPPGSPSWPLAPSCPPSSSSEWHSSPLASECSGSQTMYEYLTIVPFFSPLFSSASFLFFVRCKRSRLSTRTAWTRPARSVHLWSSTPPMSAPVTPQSSPPSTFKSNKIGR